MPLGLGAPQGRNVLRLKNSSLIPSDIYLEGSLGRLGLPAAQFRPGSPESSRLPVPEETQLSPGGYGASGRAPAGSGMDTGSTIVSRMLNTPPQPVTNVAATATTPPPALMASQVAPVGPQVTPAAPVTPSPIGGGPSVPAPTPQTAAPAPAGGPAVSGGGSRVVTGMMNNPAAGMSPWWNTPEGGGSFGGPASGPGGPADTGPANTTGSRGPADRRDQGTTGPAQIGKDPNDPWGSGM